MMRSRVSSHGLRASATMRFGVITPSFSSLFGVIVLKALSVLDLVPVRQGDTPREALANAASLIRHVESLGFTRYWVAEHHNMTGIASAATSVVIGHLAAASSTIRVGSGGVMLPNHSPLVIAEQFGTLALRHAA